MLPGLDQACGGATAETEPAPDLAAELEQARAARLDQLREIEYWRRKFHAADAEVARYQAENARLAGLISPAAESPGE